jgi:positive regulator of sigma E activity
MIEKGTVMVVKDDEIQIWMGGNAACNGCNACTVGKDGGKILTISRRPQIQCKPGDLVELDIHPVSPYISFFAFFFLPLLVMFAVYLILKAVLPDTLALKSFFVTGGTLGGLILAIPFIKMIDRYFKYHENDFVKIKNIIKMEN